MQDKKAVEEKCRDRPQPSEGYPDSCRKFKSEKASLMHTGLTFFSGLSFQLEEQIDMLGQVQK